MKAGQSIVPSLDDPRLAGHGRTPDGLQILIQPEETPEERKALLNAMADASANDLAVQDTASSLLWAAQEKVGRKLTTKEALQALLDGIYQLVEYLPDPDSMLDFYQPAELTLMSVPGQPVSALTGQPRGTGDCEDTSVLFASLVLAAARTGVFRDVTDHADPPAPRVEWLSQPGKPQNHVAAVACTHECAANDPECPDGCWWVETTLPGARIGEHPYVALERLGGRHRIEGVTRPTSAPSAAVTTGSIYLPSGEGGPENAPSGTGTIRVDGLAGQIVTLDGRAVSVLPGGTIVSPVGRHTLGVQSMGSASQVRVFVAEGATTWVELSTGANGRLTLRPMWGRLIVANWVPRSHLFLSSFPTGMSEADYSTATNVGGRLDIGLPLGTMHVSITTPRGETRTASGVRLSRSAPALLDWNTMAASHGAGIVIQNMPHGGITFIDGSRTNDANSRWLDSAMTRWFIPYVLDGVHTIRVDAHGQSRQACAVKAEQYRERARRQHELVFKQVSGGNARGETIFCRRRFEGGEATQLLSSVAIVAAPDRNLPAQGEGADVIRLDHVHVFQRLHRGVVVSFFAERASLLPKQLRHFLDVVCVCEAPRDEVEDPVALLLVANAAKELVERRRPRRVALERSRERELCRCGVSCARMCVPGFFPERGSAGGVGTPRSELRSGEGA